MSTKHALVNGEAKYVRLFIRRKQLGTTVELSERLLKAGIPASSADLSVSRKSQVCVTDHSLHSKANEEYAPSWSALKLLGMLPTGIKAHGTTYVIVISMSRNGAVRTYSFTYINDEGQILADTTGTFFDAIVELIEKLLV